MYTALGIAPEVLSYGEKILEGLKERFEKSMKEQNITS